MGRLAPIGRPGGAQQTYRQITEKPWSGGAWHTGANL